MKYTKIIIERAARLHSLAIAARIEKTGITREVLAVQVAAARRARRLLLVSGLVPEQLATIIDCLAAANRLPSEK